MSDYGNPAGLPGYDEAGEEWYASGAPEPEVRFETAVNPRPPVTGIKVFVGVVLGLVGLLVVGLIIAAVVTVAVG